MKIELNKYEIVNIISALEQLKVGFQAHMLVMGAVQDSKEHRATYRELDLNYLQTCSTLKRILNALRDGNEETA